MIITFNLNLVSKAGVGYFSENICNLKKKKKKNCLFHVEDRLKYQAYGILKTVIRFEI